MKKYIIILLILKSNITYCQSYKDYFNSGFIKDSLGEYYDAIRDFTFAIELNSNCAPCYLLRYKTAKKIEDYNTSISDISILINEFNNDKEFDFLYLERGSLKVLNKDYYDAIDDFNTYIDLYPKSELGYLNRGLCKFILEDYKSTITDMTKAIMIKPKNDIAFYYRGLSKKELKDYRGAISDYNNALLLKPRNEDYFESRIALKGLLSDFKSVIEDCNILLKINPQNGSAYLKRGLAKVSLNQLNSACLDFSKSGELGFEKAYELIEQFCQ